MQSKFVTLDSIKENYQSFFNLEEQLSVNVAAIINGKTIQYEYSENIRGLYNVKLNNITAESLEQKCIRQTIDMLRSRLEDLNSTIEKNLQTKFMKFFTLPKVKQNIKILNDEKNKIEYLLSNESEIEKNVIVKINQLNSQSLIGVPFYSLSIDDYIYMVSQNFNTYLDIKKYKVIDIIIVDTKIEPEFNCDYEFTYLISDENNNLLELPYFDFRNFNGKKAQINEKFIFTDLSAAKEHCILVLNNLKNDIEDKINKINNYD
jgi:hypothetical protein